MKRKLPALLLLIAFLTGGAYYWNRQRQEPATKDLLTLYGNVDIRKVDLGFRVGGKVSAIAFEEGNRVQSGQDIAHLEDTPYQDELKLALAQQEQAAANLAKMEAGSRPQEIAQAEALVRERQATASNLEIERQRMETLLKSHAIARELFDNVDANLTEAKARLATAQEGLKLAREGFRAEDIKAARASLQAAEAHTATAHTRLDDTVCKAPDTGIILTRVVEPGAIVNTGQTVLTLSLDSPVWIRAYIEEPNLGHIFPGMAAQVITDSRPQQPYTGHVGSISPEAEFTPKTVQTQELRTRLVYQVRIIADNPDHGLRQGMPVTIKLRTNEQVKDSAASHGR
jgi:HlyD family secretion protein